MGCHPGPHPQEANNARTLKRLKKKAGVTITTSHLSIEQVKDLSWDARKRYREAKSNAPTHRRSHLESLPPKQCNHYLRVEEQRRQGTIAHSITGKLKGARVSMVTTQNPDGQMTQHTTKRAVENAIIDANKFKYSQSTDTPPMQPSFVAEFGYTGNTPAAEAVLNGTYVPPPDCDPVLQDFLAHCKRPTGIPLTCALATSPPPNTAVDGKRPVNTLKLAALDSPL